MANACDILRRLSESVTCPVCFLILDKPKSLPCGHTFCLDCILRVCEGVIGDEDDYYDDDYLNYNEEVDVNVSIALLILILILILLITYTLTICRRTSLYQPPTCHELGLFCRTALAMSPAGARPVGCS